ncbi:hypothetical protein [Empedobacter brevis]|uniref:hypothetical protein n=1 Tax=Empedobacter brevis TaxID=247 RepID=UPI0028D70EEA|nr:hypothetical protein [Empedobacter brevis]
MSKQSKSQIVKEWKSSDIKIKKDSKGLLWAVLGNEKVKLPKGISIKNISVKLANGILNGKEVKEPNPVGAPSLYKPEYANQVYKLCLLGMIDVEIADFFNVSEVTINAWKKEYPEFLKSIRAGKDMADIEVVESTFKSTQDRQIPTEQAFKKKRVFWDKDGNRCEEEEIEIVEVMQAVPANAQIQQFWLRNRRSREFNKPTGVDHTTKGDKIESNIDYSKIPTEALQLILKSQQDE